MSLKWTNGTVFASATAIVLIILLPFSIAIPLMTAHVFGIESGNMTLPQVKDQKLKVELVTDGLQLPTSMTFIGKGDMLVTQKAGTVVHLSSSNETAPPTKTAVIKFNVSASGERGLLGVAAMNTTDHDDPGTPEPSAESRSFVTFFYLTEIAEANQQQPVGNRVYRYQFDPMTNTLSNGTLLLDLPADPGPNHNGGKMIISSDPAHLFLVIGDLNRNGVLQNYANHSEIDHTSVIIRINPDGSPAIGNPFLGIAAENSNQTNYQNLSSYYAYGIRNSFGMAIDPVTGTLWATENGPAGYDEINIVKPGFNSGWEKVMGPIERRNVTESDLINIPNSTYADPVFSWRKTVGVTDIEFLTSTALGSNYTNNIFVGDYNNGSLYYFEVNENRSGLKFSQPGLYDDLVASNDGQVNAVLFGRGFGGGITDIETGLEGYLYVLTYAGAIYRIAPR